MSVRLTPYQEYILVIIDRYGRRIAYEEFKQNYRISYHEHDEEVFQIWEEFVESMDNDT